MGKNTKRASRACGKLLGMAKHNMGGPIVIIEVRADELVEGAKPRFPRGPFTLNDLVGQPKKVADLCAEKGWPARVMFTRREKPAIEVTMPGKLRRPPRRKKTKS